MKVCIVCHQTKELDCFYALTRNKDGRDNRCRSCVSSKQKEIYVNTRNLDAIRERNIWRRYKLTTEQYDRMLMTGCMVCGTLDNLHMDHDHSCCPGKETCGKCVRGVLCRAHNIADGAFKTIEEIERYLEYRRKYEPTN